MTTAGAGNAPELLPDGTLLLMAFADAALSIVHIASADGGRLNVEGYHHNHKHGGCHYYRSTVFPSRSDFALMGAVDTAAELHGQLGHKDASISRSACIDNPLNGDEL